MKKIALILMALLLIVGLTACGNEKTESDISSENNSFTSDASSSNSSTITDDVSSNVSSANSSQEITTSSKPASTNQKPNSTTPSTTTPSTTTPSTTTPSTTTPSTTTPNKTELINQENIRHEKAITELQSKRASQEKYYDDMIASMESSVQFNESEYLEQQKVLRNKVFNIKGKIEMYEIEGTQKALARATELKEDLKVAEAELKEFETLKARYDNIQLVKTWKKDALAKIDAEIKNENDLHIKNLEALQ